MASDPDPRIALQDTPPPVAASETPPSADLHPITPLYLHAADILERVSDGFVVLDREWRVVYANRQACRINQKSLDEFRGKTLWDEWPVTVRSEVERRYRAAMADKTEDHFEFFRTANGKDRWLEIDVYPSDAGLDIFYRDITARKQTETDLRTFEFISENANDPFFLMDDQGRFVYVNAAACRALGYPLETLRTLHVSDIDPTYEGDAAYRALFEQAQRETLVPWESVHRRADGTTFPVEISAAGLNIGGRALLFASVRDVTERRRAEEERLHALARQRAFLRDVLASVTEGRLILCDGPDALPGLPPPFGPPVVLSQTEGLSQLRQVIRDACDAAGIPPDRCYDLVSASSEAGMNAVVHVGSGTGEVFCSPGMVQVRVTDQGTGIALENLPHATLKKGFTTAGTLGQGMKMMLQMVDRVFLLTGANGTTVVMEQGRSEPLPEW